MLNDFQRRLIFFVVILHPISESYRSRVFFLCALKQMFNQVKSMFFNATKSNTTTIEVNQIDTLPTTEIEALLQKFDGEYVVFTARTERGRIPLLEDEYNVTFPPSSEYAQRYCRVRRLRPIEREMSIEKIQQYELRRYRACCKHGGLSVSILWAPYKNKQQNNNDG